jgi:hypothetical protein
MWLLLAATYYYQNPGAAQNQAVGGIRACSLVFFFLALLSLSLSLDLVGSKTVWARTRLALQVPRGSGGSGGLILQSAFLLVCGSTIIMFFVSWFIARLEPEIARVRSTYPVTFELHCICMHP